MCHVSRVNSLSRDRISAVVVQGDRALARACAHARNIEQGEVALHIEQEPVINTVSVEVIPSNRPRCVVAFRQGALARTCAGGRNIERTVGAVLSPHKAVEHAIWVDEDSFDIPI